MRERQQDIMSGGLLRAKLLVQVEHVVINGLTLAYIDYVKEIRDRLGIICARAAADNDRVVVGTVL